MFINKNVFCIFYSLTGINKLEKVDMTARLFSNLGLVKECLGEYDKALELLNKSIAVCKQNDIYEQLSRGHLSIASLFEKKSNSYAAIQHYNLAIDAASKCQSFKLEKFLKEYFLQRMLKEMLISFAQLYMLNLKLL